MRSYMRSGVSTFARLAAGVFALLVFQGVSLAATRTVEVGSSGNNFRDEVSHNSTSTINVGDTVMWTWNSGIHTTTSGNCCTGDGKWDSGVHGVPFNFSHTFDTAGSFPYFCVVHGAMMTGTVIVQGAGAPPTANFSFAPPAPVMGTAVQFTDTSSGTPTSWSWNFGDPASGTNNTSALQNPAHTFQAAGTYNVSLQATNASGSNTAIKAVTVSSGGGVPCVADGERMCLNNGRFEVKAEWTKPDTTTGHGTPVKLTGDSGYFWFFDPANIELVIKVLNGCSLNNAYWVFAAGLTNVGVDLEITDTQTGIVYDKENPVGTPYAPVQDISAFPASCP